MANRNKELHDAKSGKNDEFYTQLTDVEKELRYYRPHFKGKIVLCNCNDAMHTAFATYFSMMFEILELKELICTSFAMEEGEHGVIYRYYGDKNGNGVPDIEEWEQTPMEGNGGFNTEEGIELIKYADIIVTNPPFSLFREFLATLMKYDKKFLIIGNVNAITYKEIFPLIKNNQLWLGVSITSGDRAFNVPEDYPLEAATCGVDEKGERFIRVKGVRWFTNLDNAKRHEEMDLYKKYNQEENPKYDNYDAIEVSKTADIPIDYNGVMGVPITFLDKYCVDQFEILGITENADYLIPLHIEGCEKYDRPYLNGNRMYSRLLIKRKK